MRQRQRLQVGERKYIYSELSDEGLWLEAGILFGMAMQRVVERQIADSNRRMDDAVARVARIVEGLHPERCDHDRRALLPIPAIDRSDPLTQHVFRERALLSTKDLRSRWGISESTIHRWRKSGDFPRPLQLGRSVKWRAEELENWLRKRRAL